ncbi:MAG: class I SAM-dependent rRNA methyltransferase [Oscillospiraceae bacterium]|nr:class I SAM-dependent rRNA methyltransferase [Oscillospiraceae bacterium]
MRTLKKVTVNKKAENAVRNGHPWVYGEEITHTDGNIAGGEIVDVFSSKNRYLGSGFYNPASKITVRIISTNANDKFDAEFFKRRFKYAVDYRKTCLGGNIDCCRLVFGDSDFFPGLIVDKFGSCLVTQIMSLGIESRKDILFPAFIDLLRADGEKIDVLYERNDAAVRTKEGLELYKGYYSYDGLLSEKERGSSETEITENGIKYIIDYIKGQKTGFFLDQRFNRICAASVAEGKTVLDCFTHTGAFAFNCAKGGAKHVTAVDISQEAINESKRNCELNGIKNVDFLCEDVFELLTRLYNKNDKTYDYIILDPPAFTKSRSTVTAAYNGYKEINLKAMRLLPRGGWLATCSCSHFMTDSLFRKMLLDAAHDAKVSVRIAEYRQQACDHPVLLSVPETQYLKFYLVQIV